ncbi:MAG: hypothetical protein QXR53_01900 [Candidatus Norongarragalinales archaeon]
MPKLPAHEIFERHFQNCREILQFTPPVLEYSSTQREKNGKLELFQGTKTLLVHLPPDSDEMKVRQFAYMTGFQYARSQLSGQVHNGLEVAAALIADYLHAKETGNHLFEDKIRGKLEEAYGEYREAFSLNAEDNFLGVMVAHTAINKNGMTPEELKQLLFVLARKKFGNEFEIDDIVSKYEQMVLRGDAEMFTSSGGHEFFPDGPSVFLETGKRRVEPQKLREMLASKPLLQAMAFVNHAGQELKRDPDYLKKIAERENGG